MITDESIVYVSGPMSGLPEFNHPAFFAAERDIRERFGCLIINPARQAEQPTWEAYMRGDLHMLRHATHMVMLPGWQNSRGAKIEADLADMAGVPRYELEAL